MADMLRLVGGRIKALRKARGLSQDQLGERCDFHFSYIGGVERGERNVSLENLAKIADALHVEIRELFHFEQEYEDEKEFALQEVMAVLRNKDIKYIHMTRKLLLEMFTTFSGK